ncbi:MAG: hypothetical protein Kow0019_09190 [Methanobacteriaceae archaeon]
MMICFNLIFEKKLLLKNLMSIFFNMKKQSIGQSPAIKPPIAPPRPINTRFTMNEITTIVKPAVNLL